jgi:hypothetical protein
MKKITLDPNKLGNISRKMSELALRWPNDAESNHLAALSEKILRLPKVALTNEDIAAMRIYLDNC